MPITFGDNQPFTRARVAIRFYFTPPLIPKAMLRKRGERFAA